MDGKAGMMMTHDDRLRFFPITAEAAWRRYLEIVREAGPDEYAVIEEAAWAELQDSLERAESRPMPAA
jgi:hypothetical protein